MKRFIFILSVIFLSSFIYAIISGKSGKNKEGMHFFEGTWEEALNKAKEEQKPIFLDIYARWCGPCKLLKRKTFTNKDVGNYFNANYINLSLDGEKGDGEMLANKFHITGYPTLIILNKNGEPVNMQTGYLSPGELLLYGKQSFRN